jgi:hypothetical protein
MPNGKGIGRGGVVVEDRAEIGEHEEGRPSSTRRREQARFVARTREGLAVHPHEAELLPFADRLPVLSADPLRIKPLGSAAS